jgi:hypothetical protein
MDGDRCPLISGETRSDYRIPVSGGLDGPHIKLENLDPSKLSMRASVESDWKMTGMSRVGPERGQQGWPSGAPETKGP